MRDVIYIDEIDRASALLKPMRIELLKLLAEPQACPQLAEKLGETTQKVYYHVKVLEQNGLVDKVEERRVGGIMEGLYQASGRSYWLSPSLVGRIGGKKRAQEKASLNYLLALAEELQSDAAQLGQNNDTEVPTLGLSAHIYLPDASARSAFMQEVQTTFQELARKYGGAPESAAMDAPQNFRLMLACYPKAQDSMSSEEDGA